MRRLLTFVMPSLALLTLACGGEGRDAATPDTAGLAAESSIEPGPGGWYGTQVPDALPSPSLTLTGAGGTPVAIPRPRAVTLVFLGYTHCPDICPTTLAEWRRVRRALGADTARVRFAFASVDPERDTPDVAQAYASRFDSSFVGVSGTAAQVEAMQRAFRVASFREPAPARGADSSGGAAAGTDPHAGHAMPAPAATGYTVSHASRIFVFDEAGRWRLILPASAGWEAMLADVRRLLD